MPCQEPGAGLILTWSPPGWGSWAAGVRMKTCGGRVACLRRKTLCKASWVTLFPDPLAGHLPPGQRQLLMGCGLHGTWTGQGAPLKGV